MFKIENYICVIIVYFQKHRKVNRKCVVVRLTTANSIFL